MKRERVRLSGVKRAFMGRFFMGHLACLIFLVPGSAYSATYYTAKTGSDSNPGTLAAPFLTIGKGISALGAGDVLEVGAGVYTNDPINNSVPSGSEGAYTTIRTTANAQITYSTYESGRYAVGFGGSKHHIEVNGFILGGNSDSNRVTHDNVKISSSANHIRIINCEVRYSYNQGILIADTNDNEIIDNHVHHNGVTNVASRNNQVHGIYLSGNSPEASGSDNNKIWGNDLHDNQAFDIHMWDSNSSSSISGNDIQFNKMRDSNVRGGIILRGSDNLIANNIIWDTASGTECIDLHSGSNNRVYNNTVYSCGSDGIEISGSSGIVRNNISFANVGADIQDLGSGSTLSNNLTSNPSFVNAAADDFHLQSGSVATDAGMMLAEVPTDHDRVPRPQGAGPDIGAFEYTGQAPPPTASTPRSPSSFVAL